MPGMGPEFLEALGVCCLYLFTFLVWEIKIMFVYSKSCYQEELFQNIVVFKVNS